MGSIAPGHPANIKTALRKAKALELRIAGLTYRQIAEYIKKEFGDDCPASYSERHCWNDIDDEIRKNRAQMQENTGQIIDIELQRLDKMLVVMMNQALSGDQKAVDRVLKIMERRSRYLGLDMPIEHKVNTWQTEIIQLIKEGRLSLEDARKELGDELFARIVESGSIGFLESGKVENDSSEIIEGEMAELPSS